MSLETLGLNEIRRTSTGDRRTSGATPAGPPVTMSHPGAKLIRRDSTEFEHTLRPSNAIFEMLRNADGFVNIDDLLKSIRASGLRTSDPRLAEFTAKVTSIAQQLGSHNLNPSQLKDVLQENISLINKALRRQLTIPEMEDFKDEIDRVFMDVRGVNSGKLADYIPQLARADPKLWACGLCTVSGQRHSIGDTKVPFCLQSCSKPLNYAIACSEKGSEYVHKYVGREPSGRSFNEICLDHNNKPHNPMINSGAIVTSSIIKPGMNMADRFDFMMQQFLKLAAPEYVGFNNAVFQSERVTADRNFALGYYMRENKCFPPESDMMEALELYYQLCSTEIDCESGAVIAATLANGGVNPLTGERVLDSNSVRDTLSLMHSCGMYDYSGQFAFKVGLPAKSGVAGAILIVIPDVMGICTYSPLLGPEGNSARGVAFCERLVEVYQFHHYDCLSHKITDQQKKNPRGRTKESQNLGMFNLLFAASNGELQAIKRFHLSGLDMDIKDYDGRAALHLASAEGHTSIVKFLLDSCKVNPSPVDRWGTTPLDEAERNEHDEIIEILERANPHVSKNPSWMAAAPLGQTNEDEEEGEESEEGEEDES